MEAEQLDYLKDLRLRVSSMTYTRKRWQLGAFFTWLGHQKLRWFEVTRADVSRYLSGLTCCRSVRRQMAQLIGDFYRFHGVEHNPVDGIVFKKDRSKRLPVVPNRGRVKEIIDRLADKEEKNTLRNRLIVELAYGSGLRRDELRRLNIEDIDTGEQLVHILGKGGRYRKVPVTAQAVELLREYIAERRVGRGPLLVSESGRRLSVTGIYAVLKGQVGIRPHLLRHACAGHMLQNGASIRVIQEMLGHKDLKSTAIYTHVTKEDLRKVVHRNHPRNH